MNIRHIDGKVVDSLPFYETVGLKYLLFLNIDFVLLICPTSHEAIHYFWINAFFIYLFIYFFFFGGGESLTEAQKGHPILSFDCFSKPSQNT